MWWLINYITIITRRKKDQNRKKKNEWRRMSGVFCDRIIAGTFIGL